MLLLDDPAAAVTGAPRFRRCVGLPSSSLLLELPSSEEEDRLSIVFLAAYCSLVFFVMMSWEHWSPWTRKVLTRTKENPLEVIEKTQLGCGWVAIVSNNRVSIKTGGFFDQKVGFPNKINESLTKTTSAPRVTTQYHGIRTASPCCWLHLSLCSLH